MALSALAKKQGWLVDNGHPKSYAYFMTGPNLGPDFDVDKLVAGGYSQIEIDGFVGDTQGAYNAHKTKAKVKGPAVPKAGTVPITGNACAKGAAKAVNTWVTGGQELLATFMSKVGSKFLAKNVPAASVSAIDAELGAFRSAVFKLLKEAEDQVGILSPEYKALKALDNTFRQLRITLAAKDEAGKIIQEIAEGNIFIVRNNLVGLKLTKATFKLTDNFDDLAPLFDNALSKKIGVKQFDEIEKIALEALEQQEKRAIGSVIQAIADEVDDVSGVPLFDEFAQLVDSASWGPKGPIQIYDDTIAIIENLGQVDVALINGEPVLQNLRSLDVFSRGWNDWLGLDGASIPKNTLHESMGRVLAGAVDEAIDNSVKTYSGLVNQYANDNLDEFWLLADSEGATALEFWATKTAGNDITEALLDELEDLQNVLLSLLDEGAIKEKAFKNVIADGGFQITKAKATIEKAIAETGITMPGFSATPASVLKNLNDPGYVASIKAAGTDELNPLVTNALQELDEPGSLTYFMTKKQKVDFLIDDSFSFTSYTVKYKGDEITGVGLETAKAKYAAKTGGKTASAKQTVPKQTKAGVDPITGKKAWTVPDDAPSWWADDASDAQIWVIAEAAKKEPVIDAGITSGLGKGASVNDLKKGQASLMINKIKAGDQLTTDDMAKALSFGKANAEEVYGIKSVKVMGVAEPDIDDIAKVTKAVDNGPVLSGTTTSTSNAAADFVDWDTPHTYEYVGDGAKWGGAHRKWHFTDEEGADWMLKHGPNFRGEGELAAHKIARAAGFDIAEGRVSTQTFPGGGKQTGFMQKMYRKDDIKGSLDDVMPNRGTFAGVDRKITEQVQEQQVLDWLLGNHDPHRHNFLLMNDGRVIGIDKGQSFKLMGNDQLSHNFKHKDNFGTSAYNSLWDDYRGGKIDLDLNHIDDALRRVENISDDALEKIVRDYADGRFAAPGRESFLQGTTAKNADELVELILERKRNIRSQFTDFYQDQAKARGETFSPKWASDIEIKLPTTPVKTVKPGEALTLIDDAFNESLHRAGTAGKSIYVSGSEVERGQVLFDLVRDSKGNEVLRVNLTLRTDADKRLIKLIQEESGVAIKANAPVLPSTPPAVQEAVGWHSTTLTGAKTINAHITKADFAYNQASLDAAENLLDTVQNAKKKFSYIKNTDEIADEFVEIIVGQAERSTDDVIALEKFINDSISAEASAHTQLKAAQIYEKQLEEIVENGVKGANAAKVSKVQEFDPVAHFTKVKDDAVRKVKVKLDLNPQKHVEVKPPKKVFRSVTSEQTHSYEIDQYGTDRIAHLTSDKRKLISNRNGSYRGLSGEIEDEIEMLYRTIDNNVHTQQGWMELIIKTDGEVTTADLRRALDFINDELGVSAKLADSVDMELTYWRTLQGNYKYSQEAGERSSKYFKAIQDADSNLLGLGPNPSREEEIEAIRSAWRGQFGRVIDDADTLPIHNHSLTKEADEYGWGFFERPELSDVSDLDGLVVTHNTRAGDGDIEAHFMEGATGDGMLSQAERQRYGFHTGAMSAGPDIESGGASGFFGRLVPHSSTRSNMVVINPARVHKKMGNYNAATDTYGRLENRVHGNRLGTGRWKQYGKNANNEVMMRDSVSYMDDIEITFFSTNRAAQEAVDSLKKRGIFTIRGVAVEERFVSAANTRSYTEKFFRNHVRGTGGYKERMRRSIAEITSKAGKKLEDFAAAASRLKLKTGIGSARILAKKLSAGRQAEAFFTSFGSRQRMAMRYHEAENAVSFSLNTAKRAGWLFDNTEDALTTYMGQYADDFDWAIAGKQKFKLGRDQFTDDSFVIDLTSLGIDLRDITKYERSQMLRELTAALNQGQDGINAFKATWGTL